MHPQRSCCPWILPALFSTRSARQWGSPAPRPEPRVPPAPFAQGLLTPCAAAAAMGTAARCHELLDKQAHPAHAGGLHGSCPGRHQQKLSVPDARGRHSSYGLSPLSSLLSMHLKQFCFFFPLSPKLQDLMITRNHEGITINIAIIMYNHNYMDNFYMKVKSHSCS